MSEKEVLREIARILTKPKSRSHMVGEFLREASVLLIVFVPLETVFNPGISSWWETSATVGVALIAGLLGMGLEEKQS